MTIPEIIIIALWGINLGAAIAMHGKPRTGDYSFPLSLVCTAINFSILKWAGLFTL